MDARLWGDRWRAMSGPASFALGAALLVFEAIKSWYGRPIDGELVIGAFGLCGLPLFAPTKEGT